MVLVVEDGDANRLLMLRLLGRLRVAAVGVRGGREAVEAAMTSRFALILMDCLMPGMDGLRATRVIKNLETAAGRCTPIVAMTGSVTDEDRRACLAAGMDDFLTKPVMLDALRKALADWMPAGEAGAGARPVPQGVEHLSNAGAPRPTVPDRAEVPDPTVLQRLREDGGADALAELIEIYLAELPGRLRAIHEALREEDAEGLRYAAHVLKSTSALLGGTALASVCEGLEAAGRAGAMQGAAQRVAEGDAESLVLKAGLERVLRRARGDQDSSAIRKPTPRTVRM